MNCRERGKVYGFPMTSHRSEEFGMTYHRSEEFGMWSIILFIIRLFEYHDQDPAKVLSLVLIVCENEYFW